MYHAEKQDQSEGERKKEGKAETNRDITEFFTKQISI